MNSAANALKKLVAQVCRDKGLKFRIFLEDWGLEDVLKKSNDEALGAKETVVQAIWHCCCTDGKWNNRGVAFLAFILYIRENISQVTDQGFMDLAAILREGTTKEVIARWLESQ